MSNYEIPVKNYTTQNLLQLRDKIDADIRKHRIVRARRSLVGYRQEMFNSQGAQLDELKLIEIDLDKSVAALVRNNDHIDYLLDKIEYLTGVELEDGE